MIQYLHHKHPLSLPHTQAFEYMLPIHIAASGMHMLRGHNILQRINPFALNSKVWTVQCVCMRECIGMYECVCL
jgi:hypothetical protein